MCFLILFIFRRRFTTYNIKVYGLTNFFCCLQYNIKTFAFNMSANRNNIKFSSHPDFLFQAVFLSIS